MQLTSIFAAALAGTASFVAAQPGSVYHAVIGLYAGGGCTGDYEPYAVFGATNTCSTIPTDFAGYPKPFVTTSAKSQYVEAGCRVFYYTTEDCSAGQVYGEELGHCEQLGSPFKGVKVVCP